MGLSKALARFELVGLTSCGPLFWDAGPWVSLSLPQRGAGAQRCSPGVPQAVTAQECASAQLWQSWLEDPSCPLTWHSGSH